MNEERQMRLDEEVEQQVRLACRMLKVLRHDLGNFVYPSRELERLVGAGSAEAKRYARQTRMMVSMVEEIRDGMSVVRWEPYPEEPSLTEVGGWWRRFQAYGNAMLVGEARCRFTAPGPVVVEAPATRLSVMFLALLAGLDAQIGDGFAGTLRASVEGETARLELEASLENGAAGEIMTPSLARRVMGELGGEIESRAEGSRVVSVVRLPAGSGASEVAGA